MNPKRLGYSHFVALILSILTISSVNLIHFGLLAESATPENSESSLQEISKIQAPISISSSARFRDGATISIRFTDARGSFFSLGVEQRMVVGTRGQVFINASHPSEPTAIRLKTGSLEETLLLNILRDWLQQNPHHNETELVDILIKIVETHHRKVEESNAKGIFNEQEALKLAEQLFHQYIGKTKTYKNALIRESETTFEVKFVGVKFEDNGKNLESDINIRLAKSTRQMLLLIASDVREAQKD